MGFFNPLILTQIFAQPGNPNSCRIPAFSPLCCLPHKSFLRASPLQSFVWTEILPRDRCANHVTSYAYLSKKRLNALSAAIWPCSRWKKVPIKWFSCHQNHFSRNFCYLAHYGKSRIARKHLFKEHLTNLCGRLADTGTDLITYNGPRCFSKCAYAIC